MEDIGSRILITGTFCSLNKGDAAMRIALTDTLKESLPRCHVTVMTPFPELDRDVYRSDATIQCSRRRARRAAVMIFRAACWQAIYRVFKKDLSRLLDDELKAYRDSNLIVDLSGDGITEEYGIKCLVSHLVPIVLAKLLLRPVFVCAQTIGPLSKSKSFCRYVLMQADAVSTREQLSLQYLSGLGLNGTLSRSADMAFLMQPTDKARAREILASEGVRFDRPLIGLSVSKLPGHILGHEKRRKPVALETEMANALDRIVEMGLSPVFISHTTGPGDRRDDRRAAMRVASLAQSSSEIAVISSDYSPEEIKGMIGQMDIFVGVRMHSCIAAMSMGIPTISIAYGPKAFGIMKLAAQERWVIDMREFTAGKLSGMVEDAWSQREAIRESLMHNMAEVKAMALENVEIIKRLVSKE